MQIEEAIDIIKNEIDDFVIGDYCVEICGQKDKCKDECRYMIATNTVIDELEKKDKTIKQLQEQSKAFDKQAQEYFEAVLLKDKVIDLIARMLNRNDIDEDICRQMGKKKDCNDYDTEENCINCIKEYFYKKVQK